MPHPRSQVGVAAGDRPNAAAGIAPRRLAESLGQIGGRLPMTNSTTAKIRPATKRIHAICVAVPAIPLKPSKPAMMATIKKVTAHPSMSMLRGAGDTADITL